MSVPYNRASPGSSEATRTQARKSLGDATRFTERRPGGAGPRHRATVHGRGPGGYRAVLSDGLTRSYRSTVF
eukprot:764300-Hanusia_phi.AAC.1